MFALWCINEAVRRWTRRHFHSIYSLQEITWAAVNKCRKEAGTGMSPVGQVLYWLDSSTRTQHYSHARYRQTQSFLSTGSLREFLFPLRIPNLLRGGPFLRTGFSTKEFDKMNICIPRFGIRIEDRKYFNEYTPFGSVSLCIWNVLPVSWKYRGVYRILIQRPLLLQNPIIVCDVRSTIAPNSQMIIIII